ncbi:MAG TPA: flagellar protein export ATPase FliI [Burkholderiales bacterium]|nr:flagellar protein export ATPase FliI [Burkholderiales bacterium]
MPRIEQLRKFVQDCSHVAASTPALAATGTLTRVTGLVMEAVGLRLAVGSSCSVILPSGKEIDAEVVGFADDRLFLMPASDVHGVVPGARVVPVEPAAESPRLDAPPHPRRRAADQARHVPVGFGLLGRVLDSTGKPLDALGPLVVDRSVSLHGRALNPLERAPITQVLDVGIRAINSITTVGRGQRMGLFAGSGVGKSVLLGMMARYTEAEIIVVGLIGERGREVKEFIENILGAEGRARSVVVAAPADVSPLLRLQGASYATAIAEYFRDQGKHVLLIMDSLTRYAMAQREIALAIGEPPVTKGYPPSVFAKLPQLVERAGNAGEGGGSITAFYTVLVEGDDQQDPVGDSARAILDGHIVLSRALADQGHYPAIDIEASVSRAMTSLIDADQFSVVRRFKSLYSRYQRNRDLITVGAYARGTDSMLDRAIALQPVMEAFLQQNIGEKAVYAQALSDMTAIVGGGVEQ